jgi:hypothetical protein
MTLEGTGALALAQLAPDTQQPEPPVAWSIALRSFSSVALFLNLIACVVFLRQDRGDLSDTRL